jgi:GH15 family glucan-1,4-alpha-glucosidase
VLTRPMYLVFGTDEPFPSELASTCRDFLTRTLDYWADWVRGLSISYDWQAEIIRAAITLKLSNFEETGGIVAAHTTSIPEAQGSGRNWDYRYCWLRDAYFVVKALSRIGATRTMEDFISFNLGIASAGDGEPLRPVYGIVPTDPMTEYEAPLLAGYLNNGPVRVGNAAAEQPQHDVYGSIILAALPMFVDQRLPRPGDEALFRFLEPLGEKAARFALEPDAGIWEYRGRRRVHTYSAAMCWAGCNRLATIARIIGLHDRAAYWDAKAHAIQGPLLERAWNPKRRSFTGAFDSDELDASCLLLAELGLVEPNDPRFEQTVAATSGNSSSTIMLCDMLPQTISAYRKRHFSFAGSGLSTPGRRWGSGRRRANCSSMPSRIATDTACSPRISIRGPGIYGAIFRRLIRWRDLFFRRCASREPGRTDIGEASRRFQPRIAAVALRYSCRRP